MTPPRPREVLFEIRIVGAFAKVIAIDSATGTEVSVTCPANAGEATFKAAALNRLHYVLNKKPD